MYPYALPLLSNPLYFLKSLPKCNLSSSLRSLQSRRIHEGTTEKLEISNKHNGRSSEEYEEAI